jgi:ArsR family transcriptional regulator
MDIDRQEPVTVLFKALMHPARLAILEALRDGSQCVCHLEAHLGYRQAYVSQQLAALREAGLISDQRDGLNIYYRVTRPEVFNLIDAARAMLGVAEPRNIPRSGLPVPEMYFNCPQMLGASSLYAMDQRGEIALGTSTF